MVNLDIDIEYPDERIIESIRQAFADLIDIGAKVWGVEYGGYLFHFSLLQEWEEREIARRLSGLDLQSKAKLIQLETLVKAIISITDKTNTQHQYLTMEKKEELRHLLLAVRPPVIEYLYNAYVWGANRLRQEIEETYGKLEQIAEKGFFVSSGD